MGLKSVRKNKKPTTPIVEPPPPTNSSSSPSSSDNNTAVSATSSSTSSSNAAVPTTTSTPPTATPTISPTTRTSSSSSDDDSSPPPIKATPISTSSKRPAETDTKPSEKRPKKDDSIGPVPGPTVGVAATPQKLFQRLWSNEDEIVILKGMIDFKGKKGIDPMFNIDDFLSFIIKSLRVVDVKKGQIRDKIQRLKKRFFNAKKKKLSDPHEIMAFDLSKKIWGGLDYNAENRVVVDDNDDNKKGNNVVEEVKKGVVGEKEGNVKGGFGNLEFGFSGEDEVVLKEVMKRLGEREKGEVKKMVGKANEAYLEAYLLRLKVLEVAAKKMLDGLRKD